MQLTNSSINPNSTKSNKWNAVAVGQSNPKRERVIFYIIDGEGNLKKTMFKSKCDSGINLENEGSVYC